MGITPFFVENVSELQLCAIKLVTAVSFDHLFKLIVFKPLQDGVFCLNLTEHVFPPQVFSRYEKHRQLILEEIFTSLARLPTSKRSLRNFRLADISF